MNTCGDCLYYTGAGDWDLCCLISHPTEKEKEKGIEFYFGHYCTDTTEACDKYIFSEETKQKTLQKYGDFKL